MILEPGDNWAPLALVDGKLLVRGQKELMALQVVKSIAGLQSARPRAAAMSSSREEMT